MEDNAMTTMAMCLEIVTINGEWPRFAAPGPFPLCRGWNECTRMLAEHVREQVRGGQPPQEYIAALKKRADQNMTYRDAGVRYTSYHLSRLNALGIVYEPQPAALAVIGEGGKRIILEFT